MDPKPKGTNSKGPKENSLKDERSLRVQVPNNQVLGNFEILSIVFTGVG